MSTCLIRMGFLGKSSSSNPLNRRMWEIPKPSTSTKTRPEHERRGMGPFRPIERQTRKGWSHSFKGRVTTGVVRDQPTLSSTTTDARPTESRKGEVYGKAEEIIPEASRADQSGQRATLYPGGLPAQRPHYREVRQGEPGDLPHHPDLWRPDP